MQAQQRVLLDHHLVVGLLVVVVGLQTMGHLVLAEFGMVQVMYLAALILAPAQLFIMVQVEMELRIQVVVVVLEILRVLVEERVVPAS